MNENNAAQAAQNAIEWATTPGAVENFPATARAHINGLASLLLSKLRAPVADELPHWEEISAKLERDETLTPLELFIYENEPAGDDAAWRDQLAAALASAPVASAEVMDALNWVDDFIARCNRDDRGSCESVNVLRRALASAPVADPETMEEIHRRERERAPWALPKDPTLPDSAPVAGEAQDWPTPAQEAEAAKQWDAWAHEMNQCRDASLEQAARICDAEGQEWDSDAVITEKNYAAHCARRIRTLKWSAAPQASEAVRILFPTHLRKMWSGGEVQAWLDEHQGVTAPKPSAKGSLERYRKWQAERDAINTFGSKVFKALAAIAKADGPDTRKEDDPELIYREPVMDEVVRIRQAYDELSAALSAQPGAQKNGGSDA